MGRFDFAEQKGGGLWSDGWYAAVVVAQYEAGENRTVFKTEDSLSQAGDSRNLRICFGVVKVDKSGGFETSDTRYINHIVNYIPSDMEPERIKEVQEYTTEHKGTQVKHWTDKPMQRAFLTYSKFHELERLLGAELPMNGSGFDPTVLVKCEADVRLYTDERNGRKFNAIGNVANRGTKVKE